MVTKRGIMLSDNLLVIIFQWVWVTIVALLGYLFRKVFVMDKEIGLIKQDMANSKEQRAEMLDSLRSQSESLDEYNDSVVKALNHNTERLTSIEVTLCDRHHAARDG